LGELGRVGKALTAVLPGITVIYHDSEILLFARG
jgi:hypothetical protein